MKYLVITQVGMVRRQFPTVKQARAAITRSYPGCTICAIDDRSMFMPGDHLTLELINKGHISSTQERIQREINHQRRIADHIDGYDRDDLGESPDY